MELARKSPLLEQGEISSHLYIVESGCLRLWHNDEGNDMTVQFFLAGETVSSFESFLHDKPSQFGIEAIVPSTVQVVKKAEVQALIQQSPVFRDHMFDALVSRLTTYQNLFLNTIMASPQRRYQDLLNKNPRLFEIVPQHYIASFLGITPVSLSRIRKKFKNC